MSTTYKDVEIKCPFFKEQNPKNISCEGLVDDSIIKLCFVSPKAKDTQTRIFCEKSYKNCEIYRILEKKYEE